MVAVDASQVALCAMPKLEPGGAAITLVVVARPSRVPTTRRIILGARGPRRVSVVVLRMEAAAS